MKRFRRAMLNGLTMVSIVLSLAMAASWVRSHLRFDGIEYMGKDSRIGYWLAVPKGRLEWNIFQGDLSLTMENQDGIWYGSSDAARDAEELPHTFLRIGWKRNRQVSPHVSRTQVSIPHAYLVLVFCALPAIRLYRRVRRGHIVLIGHCRSCGYDLRATPDRCPECGTTTSTKGGI